ncbi:MAG: hypothetical protein QOI35_3644, partial [Cryptosporangiaceae bacterium]|nr:hypothetical protein [Cryptosporangiaceae bacterium]
ISKFHDPGSRLASRRGDSRREAGVAVGHGAGQMAGARPSYGVLRTTVVRVVMPASRIS